MASAPGPNAPRTWHETIAGQLYTVSTSPALLSRPFCATALSATQNAPPLPPAAFETLLANSLCLGLYVPSSSAPPSPLSSSPSSPRTPSPTLAAEAPSPLDSAFLTQIGFLRLITDHTTFYYLSDIYITPGPHQRKQVRAFLVAAAREIIDCSPYVRRVVLLLSENAGGGAADDHDEEESEVQAVGTESEKETEKEKEKDKEERIEARVRQERAFYECALDVWPVEEERGVQALTRRGMGLTGAGQKAGEGESQDEGAETAPLESLEEVLGRRLAEMAFGEGTGLKSGFGWATG